MLKHNYYDVFLEYFVWLKNSLVYIFFVFKIFQKIEKLFHDGYKSFQFNKCSEYFKQLKNNHITAFTTSNHITNNKLFQQT